MHQLVEYHFDIAGYRFTCSSIVSILRSIVSLALPSFRFCALSFHFPSHRFDFTLYRFTCSPIVSIQHSIVSLPLPSFRFNTLSFHSPPIVSILRSIVSLALPSFHFCALSFHFPSHHIDSPLYIIPTPNKKTALHQVESSFFIIYPRLSSG
ncbi:hypothetical protein J2S05_001831 [Alkalicoccobacillus murimartini]|uniref:Uncharacterized protein n=1 Tax=Alkalicoccobacillus murimartini TaxID=171685 RepID=A0ABT9YGR6_9BACI|nr:hypothetical protein [Alkalicoccobacillus murimartini]